MTRKNPSDISASVRQRLLNRSKGQGEDFGMGVKQRRKVMEQLAAIPDDEERLILATGRYIGEGFDDARLDTLFLALPFSWKGMLVQYAGRLHRLHSGKVEVRVYDYLDGAVPMLAKMHEKRLKGFRMGYQQ